NGLPGDYILGKTLGAGSIGRVKLAHDSITGEKFAVKILPRVYPGATPSSAHDTSTNPEVQTKQANKDTSKEIRQEIRTIREAALLMLLHHPYIYGMREMITHRHHYYMVLEYVNGSQMLDYIVRHGRLRERVTRNFARQIGSALEYCHRNNVIHRDLKLESILIYQTGNIKIIGFGLSNIFDPVYHLSTFCGSLYFVAPEILSAKLYTGPEVDVWSFGVVLYALVCGKVPFDDESLPALHAKIKRGLVEYPVWLSAGEWTSLHLLSLMLVTNPSVRAPLAKVLSHPWMVRSFSGPPDSHLVRREPLRSPEDLDLQVIKNMNGLGFGSDEEVERRLIDILESESYKRAVQYWERKGDNPNNPLGAPTEEQLKRFAVFGGYQNPQREPADPMGNKLDKKREKKPAGPAGGFHPLLSVYFLAREKLERESVYGPGHFVSATITSKSLSPLAATTTSKEESVADKPYHSKPLPMLPAPTASRISGMSYDATH
ncbi:hypothetical protein JAAARDRAFT_104724, partial [Jaapia argillacea MUCL 33604]